MNASITVLIYGKSLATGNISYFEELYRVLTENGFDIYVYDELLALIVAETGKYKDCATLSVYDDLKTARPDYVLTLGGDGTILSAITLVRDLGIPIVGINLGRLGFLASIEKIHIAQAIDRIKTGNITIQERAMVKLESTGNLFSELNFALNDFTILKRDNSSMIVIHTYINGDFLNSYWADGLIVSTPTGSTGYNLSCGGPIVAPLSGNFIITPVAPHNLNVRPMVISDSSSISFEVEGRSDNFLCTLDSRFEVITSEHRLTIKRCDFNARIVMMKDNSFLKTLSQKLSWGLDTRNAY